MSITEVTGHQLNNSTLWVVVITLHHTHIPGFGCRSVKSQMSKVRFIILCSNLQPKFAVLFFPRNNNFDVATTECSIR